MKTPIRASDLHGIGRLGLDGVHGLTDLIEHMHHAILRVPGVREVAPDPRTSGITGLVYRSIHQVTGVVGDGLNLAFTQIVPRLTSPLAPPADSPSRERFLAVINGVLGDHLAATDNPLAIRSTLRWAGQAFSPERHALAKTYPNASSRLLVTAHGLCMHDGHWHAGAEDENDPQFGGLPRRMAEAHGYSTVDFYYNTGRHISDNGREFADLLERLVSNWPIGVEELVILGHSMGGLVARSAVHYAREAGHAWPARLKKLVFLGTPHHGSPVERAGHGIDRVLGISRYSAPFTRLGKIRSSGITDLRHGNIIETDWGEHDRFAHAHDTRGPAWLPAHVECFAVAATLDQAPDSSRSKRFGDGLVPVPSALGEHRDPALQLPISTQNCYIATRTGHLDLLRCPGVARQVHDWLA